MSKPSPARYRTTNWSSYTASLCRRGSLLIWLDKDMTWLSPHDGSPGRPAVFSDAAIQFCLTIKVLFKLPLRKTTGMVASLLKLADLDWAVPDYTTLCRRQKTLAVQIPYRRADGPLTGVAGANGDDDLEAGGNDVEPFRAVFANLHHIGAAAGTDLLRGFYHLLDARQVVWQMAKVAIGREASCLAIGVAFDQRIPRGLGFGDHRFQILKSQLTRIGGQQLLGPLAIKRMAQLGDEVILTFGLRLKPCDLGLHGRKRLTHGGRKAVQIKGEIGGRRHGDLYRTPA